MYVYDIQFAISDSKGCSEKFNAKIIANSDIAAEEEVENQAPGCEIEILGMSRHDAYTISVRKI